MVVPGLPFVSGAFNASALINTAAERLFSNAARNLLFTVKSCVCVGIGVRVAERQHSRG